MGVRVGKSPRRPRQQHRSRTRPSSESSIIVAILARACQTSFSPSKFLFFENHVSDFRSSSDTYKNGFAAGVYDVISAFAAAAKGSEGVTNQKTLALYRCLDGKGDKLGELRSWVDSAVTQASILPKSPKVCSSVIVQTFPTVDSFSLI